MKRSVAAIIQELRTESEGSVTAGLIVRFESSIRLLTLGEAEPAAMLEGMIGNGGSPAGFYRVTASAEHAGGLEFSIRPIQEMVDDPGIGAFLLTVPELIQHAVLKEIMSRGGTGY